MFGSFDTSVSALTAQQTRLDVISANMANANSFVDEQGRNIPFRRRIAMFAPGDPASGKAQGVHVKQIALDQSPFRKSYVGTGHPLADKDGYIRKPNIDPAMEMINALEAARAYEANITAVEATKAMMNSALRLIA